MAATLHGPAPCPKCGYDATARVASSWTFTIARRVQSLNRRVGKGRWSAIRAYKDDKLAWGWELRKVRIEQRIPSAAARRRVTLTRLYSGRERAFDRDNLSGGLKLVVDAMTLEGLIYNDTAAAAEIHYAQQHAPASGLVVLLEELDIGDRVGSVD